MKKKEDTIEVKKEKDKEEIKKESNEIEDKIDELRKLKESKDRENKDTKEKIDTKDAKINELTETLQRLQAEFENYKKSLEKEKSEYVKYAKSDLILKLLPVLDSFEIALKNTTNKEKFVKGMELIYAQLISILQSEGLKAIKAEGEKFDPYKHEVMLKEKSAQDDDIILEEFQKGYMLNDRVIRYSKVKVSEKVSKEEKKQKKE
jgi:molecular chaperone GrpE